MFSGGGETKQPNNGEFLTKVQKDSSHLTWGLVHTLIAANKQVVTNKLLLEVFLRLSKKEKPSISL